MATAAAVTGAIPAHGSRRRASALEWSCSKKLRGPEMRGAQGWSAQGAKTKGPPPPQRRRSGSGGGDRKEEPGTRTDARRWKAKRAAGGTRRARGRPAPRDRPSARSDPTLPRKHAQHPHTWRVFRLARNLHVDSNFRIDEGRTHGILRSHLDQLTFGGNDYLLRFPEEHEPTLFRIWDAKNNSETFVNWRGEIVTVVYKGKKSRNDKNTVQPVQAVE